MLNIIFIAGYKKSKTLSKEIFYSSHNLTKCINAEGRVIYITYKSKYLTQILKLNFKDFFEMKSNVGKSIT